MEAARHIKNPRYSALILRSSYPQLTAPGGLVDASMQLYPFLGGVYKSASLTWLFPSGAKVVMRHLRFDKDAMNFQGSEIPAIFFDEACQISEFCWWYLISRNRSTCGVIPYVRATCNPDPDSFVKELIAWWLTPEGFPDRDRIGTVRHFQRVDGQLLWSDEPGEDTKSFTFIPSSVFDNPALLAANPQYVATLRSLPLVERQRLLEGNWEISHVAGKVFRPDWFTVTPQLPQVVRWVRAWDFASTQELQGKDPDATASVKMGLMQNGGVIIADCTCDRLTPAGVDTKLKATAGGDGPGIPVRWQRDPGQAGEYQNQALRSQLPGFDAKGITTTLSKLERANPLSRAAEFGELYLLQGSWNNQLINELVSFPDGAHDDITDAAALAYLELMGVGVPKFGSASFR